MHEREVLRTRQDEAPVALPGISLYLNLRQDFGDALHLVDDHVVGLKLPQKRDRIGLRELALGKRFEIHIAISGKERLRQSGLAALTRPRYRDNGIEFRELQYFATYYSIFHGA